MKSMTIPNLIYKSGIDKHCIEFSYSAALAFFFCELFQ